MRDLPPELTAIIYKGIRPTSLQYVLELVFYINFAHYISAHVCTPANFCFRGRS